MVGSLNALPQKSSGQQCSIYTVSARQYIVQAGKYFESNDTQASFLGISALHDGFSFFSKISYNCYYAFTLDLSRSYFTWLFSSYVNILVNLAYNLGFMFTDVINYYFYDPSTVPYGDWAFFLSYIMGDFVMRIFYHDE